MDRSMWAEVVESRIREMSSHTSCAGDTVVRQESWMAHSITYYAVGMNAGAIFYLGVDVAGAVWSVAHCVGEYEECWAVDYVGRLEDAGYIGHY